MTDLPAMFLWTDAYLADTCHLTTFEHGAYLLILMAMHRSGGYLPNDDERLARTAKTTVDRWRRIAPTIRLMLTVEGDLVTQKRLLRELGLAKARYTRLRQAASCGGHAKALKYKERGLPQAMPRHSNQNHNQNKKEEANASSKEARKSAPRATRLTKDFRPSSGMIEFAREAGLTDAQIEREAAAMADWSAASPDKGAKLDWEAAWRGWIRRRTDTRNGANGRDLFASGKKDPFDNEHSINSGTFDRIRETMAEVRGGVRSRSGDRSSAAILRLLPKD